MRYLKFYEAFKSKGISNTIKFLKSKVGQSSSQEFISSLKDFMTHNDFPIDILSDDDIKYMSAKKALLLKSDKQLSNSKGIWVLKYWFSLDKGFLGYTATGNQTSPFKGMESSEGHDGLRSAELFTDRDLEHIKENITSMGEIWPVTDYKKLKTGDIVIGRFDSEISLAKIFVDEPDNHRVYAIQGVASGSEPRDASWTNLRQYGDLSWWLYDNSEMGHDHRKLHFYRSSSNELTYVNPPVDEVENTDDDEILENPLEWNLPLSNRFAFSTWGRSQFSINSYKKIEEADFALVLYFDDMLVSNNDVAYYEKPSETKQRRGQEKMGASKFMSDSDIRRMNIERYIQKLSASLNITESEFFNLEKIVSKFLSQEFSFISIFLKKPDWEYLEEFTSKLYAVVDCSDDEKSFYIERVRSYYQTKVKDYYTSYVRFQDCKKYIVGDSQLKKIFDEIYKLGLVIHNKLAKTEINTIEDLFITTKKFESLSSFIRMSRNQLNYNVRELMSNFRYGDDTERCFEIYKQSYDKYDEDLIKIKRIEQFVNSL
jgi:hypothetical protein